MDFAKAVTILVTRILACAVTDGFVLKAPGFKPTVDVVFVGEDNVPVTTVALIIGSIVVCCTFSSIRSTRSPPRAIMPKTGGFSVSSVPRPRSLLLEE